MSVILDISDWVVSKGWSGTAYVSVTNSGTENVRDVYLKITDSVVFSTLEVFGQFGFQNALNAYTSNRIQFAGDEYLLAGATEAVWWNFVIKLDAPIKVHNFQCDWTFTVY